ncbi:hypothetical protein RF11_10700 [Thelohanellus kitauei]|uniref:Uncharacterized protein n=1 Tax=Thelohanellus kitauei TaxID=669202 RepID=A0A0C2J8H9_THEKT|nr:hypothetical protein RF11_10700 [Thelohanellus kitauei]
MIDRGSMVEINRCIISTNSGPDKPVHTHLFSNIYLLNKYTKYELTKTQRVEFDIDSTTGERLLVKLEHMKIKFDRYKRVCELNYPLWKPKVDYKSKDVVYPCETDHRNYIYELITPKAPYHLHGTNTTLTSNNSHGTSTYLTTNYIYGTITSRPQGDLNGTNKTGGPNYLSGTNTSAIANHSHRTFTTRTHNYSQDYSTSVTKSYLHGISTSVGPNYLKYLSTSNSPSKRNESNTYDNQNNTQEISTGDPQDFTHDLVLSNSFNHDEMHNFNDKIHFIMKILRISILCIILVMLIAFFASLMVEKFIHQRKNSKIMKMSEDVL